MLDPFITNEFKRINLKYFRLIFVLSTTFFLIQNAYSNTCSKLFKDTEIHLKVTQSELEEVLSNYPIEETIKLESHKGQNVVYIATFKNSRHRAIMKEVTGNDIGVDRVAYLLNQRMNFNSFPFTIYRNYNGKTYVVYYFLEGFNLGFPTEFSYSPQVIRDQIFSHILGDIDHFFENIMFNPLTKEVFYIDATDSLTVLKDTTPSNSPISPDLWGAIPFSPSHFRNDIQFYKKIMNLDSNEIYKDLDQLLTPEKKQMLLYSKLRFENFQNVLRDIDKSYSENNLPKLSDADIIQLVQKMNDANSFKSSGLSVKLIIQDNKRVLQVVNSDNQPQRNIPENEFYLWWIKYFKEKRNH